MKQKPAPYQTLPKRDLPELNRKLAAANEFCSRICGENGIRKLQVTDSFFTRLARRQGNRIYLNPLSMNLLNDREIAAVVGHEIGHAAQPEYGILARLFVQRKLEYKADAFSAEATGDPDALALVLGKRKEISFRIEEGAVLRLIHKLVEKLTHPSDKKRIARLTELKERMKWEDMLGGQE